MGRLKQLLPYRGRTLLEHAILQARDAEFAPIVVVVGAEGDAIRAAIQFTGVEIVENPFWQTGLGSSISIGAKQLEGRADSVIFLTGDQPLVTAQHLAAMRDRFESSSAAAVAAEYSGTLGVPAIFEGALMERLSGLPAAAGAKFLLRDPSLRVVPFPLPEAAADIDTPEDWQKLMDRGV